MERRIIFRRKNGRVIPIAATIGAGVGAASGLNYAKKNLRTNKRALVKLRKKYLRNYAVKEGRKFRNALRETNVVFTDSALRKKGYGILRKGKKDFAKAVRLIHSLRATPAIVAGAAIGAAVYGGAAYGGDAVFRKLGWKK